VGKHDTLMEVAALLNKLCRPMTAKMYLFTIVAKASGRLMWSCGSIVVTLRRMCTRGQFSALLCYSRYVICDMFLQNIKVNLYLNRPNICSTQYVNAN
jgi:hypothetical protein